MVAVEPVTVDTEREHQLDMVANVVSAFISNNKLDQAALIKLIADVNKAFSDLGKNAAPPEPIILEPAVPIKKSVTNEYIVCLEDGLKFRSLKRHLRTKYNMSPDDYRKKWGLPTDYPMVSPAYSAARSQLAKDSGLGQMRKKALAKTAAKASPKPAAKKQSRGKKG